MSRIGSLNTHKFDKENQVGLSNTSSTTEFKDAQKLILKPQTKIYDSSVSAWLKSVVNNESNTDVLGSLYSEFSALVKKYPEAHKDKPKFNAIREYIIQNLSTSLRYSNDHRLLEIWLRDPLLNQNYEIIFEKMMTLGVCKYWGSLYITISECAQKAGRLEKAKYFCKIGLENKAEPPKALLNRIEEVETLINVELKAKKKVDTSFRVEGFKRPSSTLVYSSASKKSNILTADIFGPEIQYLKVSHTESEYIKNPRYFEKFTEYHDDKSYLRKVPNERTMSRCFMKGKIADETYEEHRARVYSSRKSYDKKPEKVFEEPFNTPNRNRSLLGNSHSSLFSTPSLLNSSSFIRQRSESRNRIQALRSNSNASIISNSDHIQFSSQPSGTPRSTASDLTQTLSQPSGTPKSSIPNNTPRGSSTNNIQISSQSSSKSATFTPNNTQKSSQLSSASNRIHVPSQSSNISVSFTPNRAQSSSQLSNASRSSTSNRIQASSPAFSVHTDNYEPSQESHLSQTYIHNHDLPASSQLSNISTLSQNSTISELNRGRIFSQPPILPELEMPSFISQTSELDIADVSNISGFEPNTTIGFTNLSLHQTPTSVRNRNLQRQTITPYPDPEDAACTESQTQSSEVHDHDYSFSQEKTLQLGSIISGIQNVPRKRGSFVNMFNRDSSPDTGFVVYRDP